VPTPDEPPLPLSPPISRKNTDSTVASSSTVRPSVIGALISGSNSTASIGSSSSTRASIARGASYDLLVNMLARDCRDLLTVIRAGPLAFQANSAGPFAEIRDRIVRHSADVASVLRVRLGEADSLHEFVAASTSSPLGSLRFVSKLFIKLFFRLDGAAARLEAAATRMLRMAGEAEWEEARRDLKLCLKPFLSAIKAATVSLAAARSPRGTRSPRSTASSPGTPAASAVPTAAAAAASGAGGVGSGGGGGGTLSPSTSLSSLSTATSSSPSTGSRNSRDTVHPRAVAAILPRSVNRTHRSGVSLSSCLFFLWIFSSAD
jgi:hypothetical protein